MLQKDLLSIENQSVREKFIVLFMMLSKAQREIWKTLSWFTKNKYLVFPSHQKIASLAKCSVRTVIRAMQKFLEYSWIGWKKRCYRSNVYFMSDEVKDINPCDKNIGDRPACAKNPINSEKNVTENVTLYSVSSYCNKDIKTRKATVALDKKSEEELPLEIQNLPIAQSDKKEFLQYPRNVFMLALEDTLNYAKKTKIGSFYAVLKNRIECYLGNREMPWFIKKNQNENQEIKRQDQNVLSTFKNKKFSIDLETHLRKINLQNRVEAKYEGILIYHSDQDKSKWDLIRYGEDRFKEKLKESYDKYHKIRE